MSKSTVNLPPDIQPRNLLVVACTPHFFGDDYVQSFSLPEEWGLPVECVFSSDLGLMDEADALWFHGPSITKLPVKRPGQKWIMMSMESDKNYPFMAHPEIMAMFDIKMTYRLDADVPSIYANWQTYGSFLDTPLPLQQKQQSSAPVLYIASNPVPRRDNYVRELMEHIDVDSLGRCLNNKSFDDFDGAPGAWARNGYNSVAPILSRYKFYITLENSITEDYVTERIYMALSCGSVPIYEGAPNVSEFMPADKCIINTQDYSSAAELAEYLKHLDQNDSAYQEYLQWKTDGFSDAFEALVSLGSIEPKHRMAIKLLHDCDSDCNCGGRMRF